MKIKRVLTALLAGTIALSVFASCGKKDENTIVVAATPEPHAKILAVVGEILKEQGYTLEIKEYTEYVLPNTVVNDGEVYANFFQHKQYLENFNKVRGTKLVSVADVHYEPFGVYPGKTKSFDELKEGAKIAVPNDDTNEARALLLLEANGIIKLKDGVGFSAVPADIVENPKNVEIVELAAEQLTRSLQDVDLAVINGNYALQAGLDVTTQSIAIEDKDSDSGTTYTNVLVVKEGNENNAKTKALVDAIKSDKVKQFILDEYKGSVVPVF